MGSWEKQLFEEVPTGYFEHLLSVAVSGDGNVVKAASLEGTCICGKLIMTGAVALLKFILRM